MKYLRMAALTAVTALGVSAGPALAGYTVFATTVSGRLISFDADTPGSVDSNVGITGLGDQESIIGIDFRPASPGSLYGLGSGSNLYTIDTGTGVATKVGAGFTTPLVGTSFGFDFNPVIDRVRIVSDANQNIVANPDTGDANIATTVDVFYPDGDANAGADPNVIGSAYTNSFAGATSTQLYAIDTNADVLSTQANNTGVLGTRGTLDVDASGVGGFDLFNEVSYAALNVAGDESSLYFIALSTGDATLIGRIGIEDTINGLSISNAPVAAVPLPGALLAAPLGALVAAAGYRRMRPSVA